MYICSSGHDEVVHEYHCCPVCEMADEKNTKINELEDKILELEIELEELKEDGANE